MTYLKEQANNHSARHKVLALVCAVCLAVTQCALLMTITTEDVHAGASFTVEAETSYAGGVKTKESYTVSETEIVVETVEPVPTSDPEDPTDQTQVVPKKIKGYKVSDIIAKTKIPADQVDINGNLEKTDVLVKNGSSYDVYAQDGQYWKQVDTWSGGTIKLTTSYNPIKKIKIWPETTSLSEKETKEFTASAVYHNSDCIFNFDGSDDKFLKIEWDITNSTGKATFTQKKGRKATVKVTKAGKFSVTAKDTNSNTSAKASDDGKQTTTTSQTTTTKATTKSTTKNGGGGSGTTSKKDDGKTKSISNVSVSGLKKFAKNPSDSNTDKIKVYDGNERLKEGVDYYVDVDRNSKKVKIIGTGKKYSGIKTVYYSQYSNNNSGGTYQRWNRNSPNRWNTRQSGTIRTNVTIGSTATTGSVPNMSYAPGQTITVKEIHLGEAVEEQPEETYEDAYDETDGTSEEDYAEETKLDFGPAAGSAAVAIAACGAGAVGRIRRFRADTTPIDLAAAQTTSGDGPKDAPKDGPKNGAKGGDGEKAPKMSLKEKALKKIGKA